MKIPSRQFELAGGLVCPPVEVPRDVWQEHVVKHPLGVEAIARTRGRDPWNREGWDRVDPPVISEPERAEILRAIAALAMGKLRCEVPEIRGKKGGSEGDRLACSVCPPPIVVRCGELLGPPAAVGGRYAAVVDTLLATLANDTGTRVEAARFHEAVGRLWRTPEKLTGLVVLTVGLDARSQTRPIVRVSRDDGVRAEFYLEEPKRMRWRTMYRDQAEVRSAAQRINFLRKVPMPAPRLGPVSDMCVVPRHWWESHGN